MMEAIQSSSGGQSLSGERTTWSTVRSLAGGLASLAIVAVILARLSVWVQESGLAFGLLPIVVGALLGIANFAIAALANQSKIGVVLASALAMSVICVALEHGFFYLDYRTQFFASAAKNPAAEMLQLAGGLQPASLGEFLAVGTRQSVSILPGWLWWIVDAGLTIVTSVAIAFVLRRRNPAASSAPRQAG
jgi:hypothetical protein